MPGALTGVVSALGGVIWGALLGVDNQLAVVGLKVFPVVTLAASNPSPARSSAALSSASLNRCHPATSIRWSAAAQGFHAVCADDRGADGAACTGIFGKPRVQRV